MRMMRRRATRLRREVFLRRGRGGDFVIVAVETSGQQRQAAAGDLSARADVAKAVASHRNPKMIVIVWKSERLAR